MVVVFTAPLGPKKNIYFPFLAWSDLSSPALTFPKNLAAFQYEQYHSFLRFTFKCQICVQEKSNQTPLTGIWRGPSYGPFIAMVFTDNVFPAFTAWIAMGICVEFAVYISTTGSPILKNITTGLMSRFTRVTGSGNFNAVSNC